MIGTLVNAAAIGIGSCIGLLLKKKMQERFTQIFFQAVGLFTVAIGVSMTINIKHVLLVILSLIIGALIGEWLKFEQKLDAFGKNIQQKLKGKNSHFAEGATTSFLLFCVGSMTIMGAIQEGLGNSPDILYTKSIMDGFSSIVLASAFGVSVIFSIIPLLLFQGGLTLLAACFGSGLSAEMTNELIVVGGILLIGLGIKILKIKELRIVNMLPALVFICLFIWLEKLLLN